MKKTVSLVLSALLLTGCATNNAAVTAVQQKTGGSFGTVVVPTAAPTAEPTKAPETTQKPAAAKTPAPTAEPSVTDDTYDFDRDWENNTLLADGSQRVGMDGVGYVTLPADWEDDSMLDDPANITFQYWSPDYSMTVEWFSFTDEELQAMENPTVYDLESWAEDDIAYMLDEYGDLIDDEDEDIITGDIQIGSYEGYADSIFFNDYSTYSSIMFFDDIGTLHVVIVETVDGDALAYLMDLMALVTGSFDPVK